MPPDGDLRSKSKRRVITVVRFAEMEMVEAEVVVRALGEPERVGRCRDLRGFGIILRPGSGCGWEQIIIDCKAEVARFVSVARTTPQVRAACVGLERVYPGLASVSRTRQRVTVVVRIHAAGETDLPRVAQACGRPGPLPGFTQRGQQQGGQNRDDRDDDQ